MAFVIAGVSGNTGKVVAETLLAAGKKVRVLVRDAAKGEAWKAKGAEIALGSLTDAKALASALAGAEGAYLLSPPPHGEADALAFGRRVVDAVKAALETSPIPHLVWLSSVGAQQAAGTGPIGTARYAEERLSVGKTPVTFVRAPYFQENWAAMIQPAKEQSILPSFLTAGRAVAMIATDDIGRIAAELLLAGPKGTHHIEIEGPQRYTPEQVAAAFSKALGKQVNLVPLPPTAIVPSLKQAGFTDDLAALFDEMIRGVNSGHVDFEGGTSIKGKVSIETTIGQLVA